MKLVLIYSLFVKIKFCNRLKLYSLVPADLSKDKCIGPFIIFSLFAHVCIFLLNQNQLYHSIYMCNYWHLNSLLDISTQAKRFKKILQKADGKDCSSYSLPADLVESLRLIYYSGDAPPFLSLKLLNTWLLCWCSNYFLYLYLTHDCLNCNSIGELERTRWIRSVKMAQCSFQVGTIWEGKGRHQQH